MIAPRPPLASLTVATLLAASVPLAAQTDETPQNDWTVLYYGGSDNDSEESFAPDVADLRAGLTDARGLEVFCLVDRSTSYSTSAAGFGENFSDTRLYRLTHDRAERLDGGEQLHDITTTSTLEANSGDAGLVRDYVRWAKANHPAKHYALVFYSHGSGPTWCPDEQSDDRLCTAELTDVLTADDSLDLVVFDVCNMAGIENAYQWRPGDDRFSMGVVVATPMAGFPFPWQQIYERIRPGTSPDPDRPWFAPAALTPARFGALVVEETARHRRRELATDPPAHVVAAIEREAMTCMDLRHAAEVKQATDALARALAGHADGRMIFDAVRQEPPLHHYGRASFDLFELARRIRMAEFDPALDDVAARVERAADALVVSSYGLGGYDRFGGFEAGKHGVYVTMPAASTPKHEAWRRLFWLTPKRLESGPAYGAYAWCRDGGTPGNGEVETWFELLDCWFDTAADDFNAFAY